MDIKDAIRVYMTIGIMYSKLYFDFLIFIHSLILEFDKKWITFKDKGN